LEQLRHPFIITLMGYYLPKNWLDSHIIFEFLPKGNLFDALHKKIIKFDKFSFVRKLLIGFEFIHKS